MNHLFQVPPYCLIPIVIFGLLLVHCWSKQRR